MIVYGGKQHISTKFTPQIAGLYEDSMEKMADASRKRLGIDVIDIYWIHNPAEIKWLETLADKADVSTILEWEKDGVRRARK